jgi:hypothetical protein
MEIIPLLVLTIALTIGFGFLMASSDKEVIKREWSKRRCDPYVVMTGSFYKPDSYDGSSMSFASENFNYCMGKYAKGAINSSMSPIFNSFGSIIGLGGVVSKIFNSLRQTIGELFRRFTSIFDIFFGAFNRFTLQAARITQLLKASFLKINAVITTAIYMAISMLTLGLNTFNFALLVTQIIVGIITGMSFILMFFMGPIGALILSLGTAAGAVLSVGIALVAGETYEDFCLAPETKILMADGSTKPVCQLVAGDELGADCGQVRGCLVVDGSHVRLFSYKGVRVSGEHLVLDGGLWGRVQDTSCASPIQDKVEHIYCPITSSQRLPVLGSNGETIMFADWEELDDSKMPAWQAAVAKHLDVPVEDGVPNDEMGELGEDVFVYKLRGGWTPIKNIKINDMIDYLDIGGVSAPTRVIGIYKGHATTLQTPTSIGCGIWKEDNTRQWYKSRSAAEKQCLSGQPAYHLVTESGVFMVMVPGRVYNIRDFTEVGYANLSRLTPSVVSQLNVAPKTE